VLGDLSSGGLGAQPPDADENSVFNVLRIVWNFFKLVTLDTFPHNPFDTVEPTVPVRYILQVNKVIIIANIQVWTDKYFLHTLRTTIIIKNMIGVSGRRQSLYYTSRS